MANGQNQFLAAGTTDLPLSVPSYLLLPVLLHCYLPPKGWVSHESTGALLGQRNGAAFST
jgi:hypothetical protein